MADTPKSKRKGPVTIDTLPDFLSTDVASDLFGYTAQHLRTIAKDGSIPEPRHGKYQCMETIKGIVRHLKNLIARKTDAEAQENLMLKRVKRENLELDKGIKSGEFIRRTEVMTAVQVIGEEMKSTLYKRFDELPPKLQGLDVLAMRERLRAVADEVCLQVQSRQTPWTVTTSLEIQIDAPSAAPTA